MSSTTTLYFQQYECWLEPQVIYTSLCSHWYFFLSNTPFRVHKHESHLKISLLLVKKKLCEKSMSFNNKQAFYTGSTWYGILSPIVLNSLYYSPFSASSILFPSFCFLRFSPIIWPHRAASCHSLHTSFFSIFLHNGLAFLRVAVVPSVILC